MKKPLQFFLQALVDKSFVVGWIVIIAGLLMLAFGVSSCKDDDDEAADPQKIIVKTWVLGTEGYVEQDDENVTDEFPGLKIIFSSNGTYTAQNNKHLFESSGTWAWEGTGVTHLMLDGDFPVDVAVTETDLRLQFTLNLDDVEPGRVRSLIGEYDVKLIADN